MDDAPGYVTSRTCTVVDEREPPREGGRQAPLTDYGDTAAYVLIAEPGAGKTTAFETEAAKQGAVCVTVRNFLRFDRPEWRDATLFLDGLDESRAGHGDRRTPLDAIVRKLDGLGCPPFRLSCRWSFWLAANDKNGLREVSPDGTVTVVRLDPLSKRNINDILVKNHGVEDAAAFVAAARERGGRRTAEQPAEPGAARQVSYSGKVAEFPQGDVRAGLPDACARAERRAPRSKPLRPPPRIHSSRLPGDSAPFNCWPATRATRFRTVRRRTTTTLPWRRSTVIYRARQGRFWARGCSWVCRKEGWRRPTAKSRSSSRPDTCRASWRGDFPWSGFWP